jgi:ABC-type lipoprotein release transport system permease subunit
LGIILGIIVSYPLVTVGIDLSGRVGDSVQIGNTLNSAVLYGKYSTTLIASYALIAWLFSIMATIYPAWKLSTLKPIEAMRHH